MNRRNFLGAAAAVPLVNTLPEDIAVRREFERRLPMNTLGNAATPPFDDMVSRITPEMWSLREACESVITPRAAPADAAYVPLAISCLRSVKPQMQVIYARRQSDIEARERETLADRLAALCEAVNVPCPIPGRNKRRWW